MSRTASERQPLNKEVSLRFPDGSVKSEDKQIGAAFDGNQLSYFTRRDGYEAPIPEPSQAEIEEAAAKKIDDSTGFLTQPAWLSVLKKRQGVYFVIRWLLCNCFCNRRWTMTRAQWIWFLNLICFGLHTGYAIVVLNETLHRPDEFESTVWRLHAVWNASATESHTALLEDNMRPIRLDLVVAGFFLVSGAFHAVIVFLGPFDRYIWVLWRQIDLCFSWHRWVDYAITFPLITMTLCCITQLREQNTISAIWLLSLAFVAGLFLTELWSRPCRDEGDKTRFDMSRWTGDKKPIRPGVQMSKLESEEVCQRMVEQATKRRNYVLRMLPLVFAIFPFVTVWVIILNHYSVFLHDTRINDTDDLYKRIPDFVPMAVIGTFLLSILFFVPLLWYQWKAPMYYWKTELWYPVLSAAIKIYLGYILFMNVFRVEGGLEAALALDQNNTA